MRQKQTPILVKMPPTATSHTIVITPGTKLVTIPNPPKIDMEYSSEIKPLPKYAIGLFDSNGSGPRKRKRLTHLTPEEKIMRRKLKNRVAAQTARDRKKIRMEGLEETIQKVQQQAKELLDVNIQLLERAEALERENTDLRNRLGLGTETNTNIPGNRKIVERIEKEFDEYSADLDQTCMVPDSMLSPDESADEADSLGYMSHNSSFDDDEKKIRLAATECVSPGPAAGSCSSHVDPLHSCHGNDASITIPGENCKDDDILGLLEQIGSNFDPENFLELSQLTSSGLDNTSTVKNVTDEQLDSIKELINVDHLYSKPREEEIQPTLPNSGVTKRPSFKIQLSRSAPSTKLIKQPSSPAFKVELKPEDKPIALCEEMAQTVTDLHKQRLCPELVQTPTSAANCVKVKPPMLCNIKQEVESFLPVHDSSEVLDFDNLDAELDDILSGNLCGPSNAPLVIPMDCDAPQKSLPCKKLCISPSSMSDSYSPSSIDTPSPMSDLFEPFQTDLQDYNFFNDASVELFPQLAAVI